MKMPSVDETNQSTTRDENVGGFCAHRPPAMALIVDPDVGAAARFAEAVEHMGLQPLRVSTGAEALARVRSAGLALAILDTAVTDIPARLLLRHLAAAEGVPVIVASATPTVRTAVEMMQAGAADVLDKGAAPDELWRALNSVLLASTDVASSAGFDRGRIGFFGRYTDFFRRSEKMRAVEETVTRVAGLRVPLLVRGEHGVGKEQVALAVHYLSDRTLAPFVKIACACLPPDLVEAEIFGDRGGADGKISTALGGTAFLDEIADVPPAVQARLVRLLDDGTDVRLIAATSTDVYAQVVAGRIRSDLYERLSVATISVPPLRERREEIEGLVRQFLERFSAIYERPAPAVSDDMAEALRSYDWPGNIRELENMIKRWIVLGVEADVREELAMRRAATRRTATLGTQTSGLRDIGRRAAREAERAALQEALARTNGNRSAAARDLKVSYKTLLQKLVSTGIEPPNRSGAGSRRGSRREGSGLLRNAI